MLSKEEIEKAFEGMEYFIDDDFGGYYRSVVGNQDANSMLGYLKLRDYILNMQNKIDQLETNNKNLIEKLKNKQMKLLKQMQEPNNDRWEKDDERYYEEIKIQYKFLKEILEIVKGE